MQNSSYIIFKLGLIDIAYNRDVEVLLSNGSLEALLSPALREQIKYADTLFPACPQTFPE